MPEYYCRGGGGTERSSWSGGGTGEEEVSALAVCEAVSGGMDCCFFSSTTGVTGNGIAGGVREVELAFAGIFTLARLVFLTLR